MKQDRSKLEDVLIPIIENYSSDNKLIDRVADVLVEKHNFSRGRVTGVFTQSTPINYFSDEELCLFVKHLYSFTHEKELLVEDWFNESEIQSADVYKFVDAEKTTRITLHNVDQISPYQWICTKETYQNVALYMKNGLITYNSRTQREPIVKRYGDRVTHVPNIKPSKVRAIKQEMISGNYNPDTLIWNIRKVNGLEREKFRYNEKDRTLIIEVDNIFLDVIDGGNRSGAILQAVNDKSNIDMTTMIMIYYVSEEKAKQIIFQIAKAEPLDEQWTDQFDSSNPNMEVAKNINSKQRMNEMFNRIALNNQELERENKLVTFDTLSKTIEYVYNLKEQPYIVAEEVEEHLISLFNIVIGMNHLDFNQNLSETRKTSYLVSNNAFIGFIVLADSLMQKYNSEWKIKFKEILSTLDFRKQNSNVDWKKIGMENNVNLSTIKKIADYFKSLNCVKN